MEHKKWEYKTALMSTQTTQTDLEAILSQWGSNGWELVAIDYGWFIFKRLVLNKPLNL